MRVMFAKQSYVVPAATIDLADDPLDPAQIVSGDPRVASFSILEASTATSVQVDHRSTTGADVNRPSVRGADDHKIAVGVWQHSVGVSTDVEADEIFVVLTGRATIEIDGGPTLEIGPGDVGVLTEGSRTTWTIHETLRKVYFSGTSHR